MFTIYILVILFNFGVLSSSQHRHNRAAKVQCKESIKTVVEVRTCPKDKEARDERARLKECWKVQHNCSDTPLSYHCVLDEFGHGLVEVCAMWTEIIGGECSEFTPGGMFIQEHYENSCRSCPFAYNSSMGYLYGECYDFAVFGITTDGLSTQQQTEMGFTDMTVSAANDSSQHQEGIGVWCSTFLAVLLGIGFPVASVGSLLYRIWRSNQQSKKKKAQHYAYASDILENRENDGDTTHGSKGYTSSEISVLICLEEVEDIDNEDTSKSCTSLEKSLINSSEKVEDMHTAHTTADCISSGIPFMHHTEEVESINDGSTRVLPSGRTLNSDTPKKKAMPSSSEEMPVIPLKEELNEKQAEECHILVEDLNEEIEDTTIRQVQSENSDDSRETLQKQLVELFGQTYTFPENPEGLQRLKECIHLVKMLKTYMSRERRTQIEAFPNE